MPTAFDLDMKFSVAGLDEAARLAINDFTIGAKPPLPADSVAKIAAILVAGQPKVTIAPGHLTSPSLDLTFQGELALTPPRPTGRLTVAADTLDKVLVILRKVAENNDQRQQAAVAVTFMKGLARQDADGKLVWDIDVKADGTFAVNGLPMGKPK